MYESGLAERYVNSLIEEIKDWGEVDNPAVVNTIYFGGGTPSLLTPAQIERILNAVRDRFQVLAGAEVTIELNPGDGGTSAVAKLETIRDFQQLGINRASFGAQTFDDRELKQLGRTHSSDDITSTFYQLREAGFENINFDLIAGLPGQTLQGWQRNLTAALELRPEHLSLYLLDVHEGTPLADQIKRGLRPKPDDDLAAEMYLMLIDELSTAGYEHYEISNFCLPGFESGHNTKYWTGAPYYGFGCSAHSYDGLSRRWQNEREVVRYVETIEADCSPIVNETRLTKADREAEAVFLGLRLMQGFSFTEYSRTFGADLREKHEDDLARFREAGLIECSGDLLKLTRAGALLSNEVFAAFV